MKFILIIFFIINSAFGQNISSCLILKKLYNEDIQKMYRTPYILAQHLEVISNFYTSTNQILDTIPKSKNLLLKAVEIISVRKEIKSDSSKVICTKCRNWSLKKYQIKYLLHYFQPMSSEGQYLSYSFFPCRITGDMIIEKIKYKYWIEAGGAITLKNNDQIFYFGCKNKIQLRKYFISNCD